MLRRYKVNNGKNFLKSLLHLEPDARALSLATNTRYNFMKILFSNLYLFDSIFSIIVWTNRFHDFDKGICFPDNCCYENG